MIGYDEGQVVAFEQDVVQAYKDAGHIPDLENVVWSGRMVYDAAAVGMGWEASRVKHLAELKAALGSAQPTPIPPSPIPPNGEGGPIHGRLRGENNGGGPRLVDALGSWKWKVVTAFDAQRLASLDEWEKLKRYAAWTRSVGGNGWRVFLNWKVTSLDFRSVPGYFQILKRLCEFAHGEQLRLLGTAICDQIPGGLTAQQDFIDQAFEVLNQFDHTMGECANEPYNGNSELPTLYHRSSAWSTLLVARGMCRPDANPASGDQNDKPYLPSLGFTTYQTGRSDDWYRKVGKDGMEIRNGVLSAADGTHDATINNEMMGAAENSDPGRRSNNPSEFFLAGCAAAMFNSGATGHGDSLTMQRCDAVGPTESKCIQELFRGIDVVPAEAPVWEYTRYGPNHPPAPMPVEPDPIDGEESRMHAMIGPQQAVAINYRYLLSGHDAWKPKGVNGWHVTMRDGPFALCTK